MEREGLLTASDVRRKYGIPRAHLARALVSGDLPAIRFTPTGRWWIRPADVERWLGSKKRRPPNRRVEQLAEDLARRLAERLHD